MPREQSPYTQYPLGRATLQRGSYLPTNQAPAMPRAAGLGHQLLLMEGGSSLAPGGLFTPAASSPNRSVCSGWLCRLSVPDPLRDDCFLERTGSQPDAGAAQRPRQKIPGAWAGAETLLCWA